MTKKQALQLLQLIADLYGVINAPDAPPAPANGRGDPAKVKDAAEVL